MRKKKDEGLIGKVPIQNMQAHTYMYPECTSVQVLSDLSENAV